tara:strand:- start:409 stop:597 length:189 start_codon:yes stop_codon:yes gene_type:complete
MTHVQEYVNTAKAGKDKTKTIQRKLGPDIRFKNELKLVPVIKEPRPRNWILGLAPVLEPTSR